MSFLNEQKTHAKENASLKDFNKKLFEEIHGISPIFKINYAFSPKLKYDYPPINLTIIDNIVSALVNFPKFYTQTLHLMNKMNLPCPLVSFVRMPRNALFNESNSLLIPKTSQVASQMEVDLAVSEAESELESQIDDSF